MKTCSDTIQKIAVLIGAWGVVGSLFFTIAFTFREDVWQIFGRSMIIIITLLALNSLACVVWIYGAIYNKHWLMLASLIYWLVPLFYCARFIWMPIKHNRLNRGEYLQYFNVEEDELTYRFEMTMTRPEFLPIYSSIFVFFFLVALICFVFIILTRRPVIVDDPRFDVQNVYKAPSIHLQKGAQESQIY